MVVRTQGVGPLARLERWLFIFYIVWTIAQLYIEKSVFAAGNLGAAFEFCLTNPQWRTKDPK